MLFDFDLIVPNATPQSDPAELVVHLTRGIIRDIRIIFPPGPATLVHVQVLHNLFQLVPANPDGTLNYDDTKFNSPMEYVLDDSKYDIILRGWSPDAVYSHTINFQFDLGPLDTDNWNSFVTDLMRGNNAG